MQHRLLMKSWIRTRSHSTEDPRRPRPASSSCGTPLSCRGARSRSRAPSPSARRPRIYGATRSRAPFAERPQAAFTEQPVESPLRRAPAGEKSGKRRRSRPKSEVDRSGLAGRPRPVWPARPVGSSRRAVGRSSRCSTVGTACRSVTFLRRPRPRLFVRVALAGLPLIEVGFTPARAATPRAA